MLDSSDHGLKYYGLAPSQFYIKDIVYIKAYMILSTSNRKVKWMLYPKQLTLWSYVQDCLMIETCDNGAFCSTHGDVGYLFSQSYYNYAIKNIIEPSNCPI